MSGASPSQDDLDFYRSGSVMADAGKWTSLLSPLPDDVASLARFVQGLMLHEHLAGTYGEVLTPARREESQLRDVARMLETVVAHDTQPLNIARPPQKRLIGVCRHFTLLMVTMLRTKGYAARSRCGFGTYFEAGRFVDHWVAEYWHEKDRRWVMVDAQIDDLLKSKFKTDFDVLDVPRDRFVVAGDAWMMVREGRADAGRFGIMDMWGHWFIAGNVIRDVAALNKVEMLPWDVWGAMPPMREPMPETSFDLFDRLAKATRYPEMPLEQLHALYGEVRVPKDVFNAVTNKQETIHGE